MPFSFIERGIFVSPLSPYGAIFDKAGLLTQIHSLQTSFQEGAFWSRPDRSLPDLKRWAFLQRLSSFLDDTEQTLADLDTLRSWLLHSQDDDISLLEEEIDQKLQRLEASIPLVRSFPLLTHPSDESDSFLVLEILEAPPDASIPPLLLPLVRTLRLFCQRFDWPLDGNEDEDLPTTTNRPWLLAIEGLYSYGLLKGLAGLHAIPLGTQGSLVFAIHVFPRPPRGTPPLPPRDIQIDPFFDSHSEIPSRRRIRLTHRPSGNSVIISHFRSSYLRSAWSLDYLRARLLSPPDPLPGDPSFLWPLPPPFAVCHLPSGFSSSLPSLQEGHIDPLLAAALSSSPSLPS